MLFFWSWPAGGGACMRRWLSGLCAAQLMVGAWAAEIESLAMSELHRQAQVWLEREEYAAAVPVLSEMARRFEMMPAGPERAGWEAVLFFLGLGQLQQNQPEAAAHAFSTYRREFPHGPRTMAAGWHLTECLHARGDWAGLVDLCEVLSQQREWRSQPEAFRLDVLHRWTEAWSVLEQWERGRDVFRAYRDAAENDPWHRTQAAERGLRAAIERQDTAEARAWVTASGRDPATAFAPAWNTLLLREGDRLAATDPAAALEYYQAVRPLPGLRDFQRAEIAREERARPRRVDSAGAGPAEESRELALARHRLAQAEALAAEEPGYELARHGRLARSYAALGRVAEAFWAYLRVETAYPESSYAEEALAQAVLQAAAVSADHWVLSLGERFVRKAPESRWAPEVAWALIAAQERGGQPDAALATARRVGQAALAQPAAPSAERGLYVYASTWLRADPAALAEALALRPEPAGPAGFVAGVHYWRGLACLWNGEPAPARAAFAASLEASPDGNYAEEAGFRLAVSSFAAGAYAAAQRELREFQERYPESELRCEAQAVAGDLASAEGRIEDALRAYADAEELGAGLAPPHLAYINHAVFQAGRLLAANGRWRDMEQHFDAYLRRWGSQGDWAAAVLQRGRAREALGDGPGALTQFEDALHRFGNDPRQEAVDALLREYVSLHRRHRGEPAEGPLNAWLAAAEAAEERAWAWRLRWILATLAEPSGPAPSFDSRDLPDASPAVLAWMGEHAGTRDPQLAEEVWDRLLAEHPDSDLRGVAWNGLAALRRQRGEAEAALTLWRQVAKALPGTPEAGQALLQQGELLTELERFAEAAALYREVLGTRLWRGRWHAEANLGLARWHRAQGQTREASGYFVRVYTLYGTHLELAAAAYVENAACLEELGEAAHEEALWRELRGRPELRATHAYRRAFPEEGREP